MKTKHVPVYRTIRRETRRKIPALRKVTSATEASKLMFGIKGMIR